MFVIFPSTLNIFEMVEISQPRHHGSRGSIQEATNLGQALARRLGNTWYFNVEQEKYL